MSNLKRKAAPGGHPPAKSAKGSKAARPSKNETPAKDARPKKAAASSANDRPANDRPANDRPANDRPATAPVVSLLRNEEPMFPRGGGSVLTPLEQKQIHIDAKADALREEEFNSGGGGGSKPQGKPKRRTAPKDADRAPGKMAREDTVKVESLNFKKLVKGSLVLGQVSRINALDLEISLPYNLTGHVSIVQVSDQLTARLDGKAGHRDDSPADDSPDDDDSDVRLKSIFAVGQYLRAYVTSTAEESVPGRGRRKIELSLRPAEANAGLADDDVVPCSTVMASVVSVEDRGCVMDLGIAGLRAFLPSAKIDAAIDDGRLQPGAVFLCRVSGKGADGRVAQLSLLQDELGSVGSVPSEATTINTYLPGTPVSVLISSVDRRGLAGKVMGHLDVTADLIHSGAGPDGTDLEATYKVGAKVRARIICNFPNAKDPKLGISLLPHVTRLARKRPDSDANSLPTTVLPLSSLVEKCTVRHVETEIGLFVDTAVAGLPGFVHISRVKDGKVDALYEASGPYRLGSVHRGRVVGYSELDGLFHLSLQQSVLDQQYLRLEDVPVGAVVTCEVEKLVVNGDGVGGLIVKIADGVTGFVPERHMSDIRLQHPEKKFREGVKVKARVLSSNPSLRRMRLTLKKTLVNSEAPVIKSYDQVSVGMHVPGTIVGLQQNGAQIQFYGSLRGFLPVSEMSEAYIRDPADHFRVGQVVSVHVLSVDPEQRRLIVSCKDPAAFSLDKQNALKKLRLGELVSATVTQKSEDDVFVELEGSQLKAMLPLGHLTDKSSSKNSFALKRISTGQTLSGLMVIDKDEQRRSIILTQKPSLIQAARDKKLPSSFDDVRVGDELRGYVRDVTPTAVFVQFAGSLYALLPKSRLSAEAQSQPGFGLHKHDSIEVRVLSLVQDLRRIMVAPASGAAGRGEEEASKPRGAVDKGAAPADGLTFGSTAIARITSIKQTQLNVQLVGSETQGRIDVSQVFDGWDGIADAKKPLGKFHRKQQLRVKVIGIHSAKDHRFLPISHRSAHSVLELTAKPSDLKAAAPTTLTLDSIKVGDSYVAFVNNASPQFLWVNLSPSVRGRVAAMEASDDLTQLNDLEANFPVGCALKVTVTSVDVENKHLDLSARSSGSPEAATWSSIKANMALPGRVTRVNERQLLVRLSGAVSGTVQLPDMADDYDDVNTLSYKRNEIVRVSVVEVDAASKRLRLSLRPSRIMSSTMPVVDKEISAFSQLAAGDLVRGFVKNVSDKGLFVLLGGQVTAMVKIANLSDRFLKEWKDQFQVDQLVKGRVLSVDAAARQVELSLRASVVDEDYTPPITFKDIESGQVVTGKVRKVEEFGAFIVVDNSANVSGLCHRSQMADKAVRDATKLYKEGDAVKAKVLAVDAEKRRISFGLKPSMLEDEDTDMDSDGSDAGGVLIGDSDADMDDGDDGDDDDDDKVAVMTSVGTNQAEDSDSDSDEGGDDDDNSDGEVPTARNSGLGAGKKSSWATDPFNDDDGTGSESDEQGDDGKAGKQQQQKKKKSDRKGAEMQVDKTGELDAHGPQTTSDYERLLLGQPDSSELWIAYMAFQMQVSELAKAREVAERAIKTINVREETEKLNVWVAYLNLEVTYGGKRTVEELFKRACQYNDEQEVHERLASIYIQSERLKDADELFEAMLKRFGAKSPSVWTNYGHFLHVTLGQPGRARALLPRAMQQLDERHRQNIIGRFAALEFRSANGEPERGRTMFEGLLAAWPKKGDLWSQLVDLEKGVVAAAEAGAEAGAGAGAGAKAAADPTPVRDVFERRLRVRGLKPQQAERWFRRWAAWEETREGERGRDRVMARARDWTAAYRARREAEAEREAEGGEE